MDLQRMDPHLGHIHSFLLMSAVDQVYQDEYMGWAGLDLGIGVRFIPSTSHTIAGSFLALLLSQTLKLHSPPWTAFEFWGLQLSKGESSQELAPAGGIQLF